MSRVRHLGTVVLSLSVLCFNCLNDKTRMPLFVSDEKWFMMRGRHSLSRKAKQGFERRDYSTRKQLWWWWWRCPAKVPANFNYQSQEEESTSFEWHTRLKNSGEKIHSIHCLNDTLFVITVNDGCSTDRRAFLDIIAFYALLSPPFFYVSKIFFTVAQKVFNLFLLNL